MKTKKCPYCGQLLSNIALKCTRCKKWVDNEVFRRLCEDDVKLIKNKDLVVFTPTLLAMMVIDLLKKDNHLRKDIEKREKKTLNEIQRFNLLVFESFCYFEPICLSAKMKRGCKDTIKEMLRLALLLGVAELFNTTVEPDSVISSGPRPSVRGAVLYTKFEAILEALEPNTSSQLRATNALGSLVLADNSPISFSGLALYSHFMETFKHMGKEFSKMFLVEEEDFDWRAI